MMPTGPAPMSAMAIAGFVSSLIFCCLGLSPLLGLIFSLVGLSQTKGGMRRGRGLAIAGLIIAVLMVPVHSFVGIRVANSLLTLVPINGAVQRALESRDAELVTVVGVLHPRMSVELQSGVSEDQMADWFERQQDRLGGVQSVNMPSPLPEMVGAEGTLRYTWDVSCPDKMVTAWVEILVNTWGQAAVVDLVIDGESILEATDQADEPAEKSGESDDSQQAPDDSDEE